MAVIGLATLILALVATQTPWFKDWLRRYIVREAAQYLNGQLAIGRLSGNLFTGLELQDVRLKLDGVDVVIVKDVGLDYNALELVTKGLVIDDIRINQPRVALTRDERGWNLGRFVKEQAQEADREGPARPVQIASFGISDGTITIDDRVPATAPARLPARVARIDAKARFEYQPVHFTLDLDHLSFRAESPSLSLNRLTGHVSVRGDEVYFERVLVHTAENALSLEGVVHDYTGTPIVDARLRADRLTVREIAGFVPVLAPIEVQPAVALEISGPASDLQTSLDIDGSAGRVALRARADVDAAPFSAKGTLDATHLRLEQIGIDALPASDITAHANFDLAASADGVVTGRVRTQSSGLTVAGYRADRVRADVTLDPKKALIKSDVHAYRARMTMNGRVWHPLTSGPLDAELEGRVGRLDLRHIPLPSRTVPRLATDISADYGLRVKGRNIQARAVFAPSTIEGVRIERGTTAQGAYADGRVDAALRGRLRNVDVRRLGRVLDQPRLASAPVSGPLDLELDVAGSGRSIADAVGRADVFVPRVDALDGRVRDMRLTVNLSRAALDGSASAQFENLNAASIAGPDAPKSTLSGRLQTDVSLPDVRTVHVDALGWRALLELTPSTVGGVRIDRVSLDAAVDRGLINVRRLEVASAPADVSVSGTLALNDRDSSDLRYRATIKDLAALGELAGQRQLSGTGTLEGVVHGSRAALTTTGKIAATNLRYGSAADITGATSDYTVTIPDLAPSAATLDATARATLVKASGRDIREATIKASYSKPRLAFETNLVTPEERELSASGELTTGETDLTLRLDRLALRAPGADWSTVDGPATITYGGSRVVVRGLELGSGDQRISAAGTLLLENRSATVDATDPLVVRAAGVELASLDALGPKRGLSGQLDAEATVSGSMDEPVARATVTIAQGGVDRFRFDRMTANLQHDARGTELDARLDQNASQWVTAKGRLPTFAVLRDPLARQGAPIDLRVESSPIDLGVVQTLTTALRETTGRMEANVLVSGTFGDPRLDGRVQVANGAFLVDAIDTRFTGLDATLTLKDRRVIVEQFRVLDTSNHPLTASGAVEIADRSVGAVDVHVQADDFEIIDSDIVDLDVDLDLRVAGAPRGLKVSGAVGLHQGIVEADKVLAQIRGPLYSTEVSPDTAVPQAIPVPPVPGPEPTAAAHQPAETAGAPGASLLDTISADLKIHVPDNLVVRGRSLRLGGRGVKLGDMNVTLGGDVRVQKQPDQRALVVGSVHTVRGFYEFQGRRFDVQRDGLVAFKGPDFTNPTLDLQAQRNISGVDAFVRIRGTAQRPELELSSRPPLDQADILSLIVFNRPINDLGAGEQDALAQQTAALVGGMVAAPLAEAVRDALGVDLLEITAAGEEGRGPSVTVGEQIGERVFVRVRQQFGSTEATALLLEYQIAEFLRLQTNIVEGAETNRAIGNRTDRGGIDLIFVVRY